MRRICMMAIVALTAGVLAATAFEIVPVGGGGPTYSAGTVNGPICSCPVKVGNCICQWNP
jgi:hypothetical protein